MLVQLTKPDRSSRISSLLRKFWRFASFDWISKKTPSRFMLFAIIPPRNQYWTNASTFESDLVLYKIQSKEAICQNLREKCLFILNLVLRNKYYVQDKAEF